MQPKTASNNSQAGKAARGGDGASTQAASDEVQLALAALTKNSSIITRNVVMRRIRPFLSGLRTPTIRAAPAETRDPVQRTLLQCAGSLGELIEAASRHYEAIFPLPSH